VLAGARRQPFRRASVKATAPRRRRRTPLRINGRNVYRIQLMFRSRSRAAGSLRPLRLLASVACACGLLAAPAPAAAQTTFALDRLQVAGSPDDGIGIFRPVTQDKTIFFAQVGLGYSINPLHTVNVTTNSGSINASSVGVIQGQITQYSTVGFEFLDRFTVAATLPVAWGQWGATPVAENEAFSGTIDNPITHPEGPGAGDTRLDARGVVWRTRDRRAAIGAQFSLFIPTGTNNNFGGDGKTSAEVGVSAEYAFQFGHAFTLIGVLNTSVDFRPDGTVNSPTTGDGLGIGDEWRFAVAGYIPLKDNKYRVGLSIFGQTGIENSSIIGNTAFTGRNSPLEWQAEGRMRFGKFNRWWTGAGLGSRLDQAYGAPDFRIIVLGGYEFPLFEPDVASPTQHLAGNRHREQMQDRDHDGIPDDLDACPDEPEDHLDPDPNDGCPTPPDRDHDGIPDALDKCPDQPEDHKGAAPNDGCPDIDTDKDGIPDSVDACPHEPGQPSPDPKKNGCPQFIKLEGSSVRVLQQVHFAFGSAEILPDSFPMLQEIANLLKVTPSIKRMSIEGHTDDRGAADLNLRLSQARSNSVMVWLSNHGVEAKRLEAHGYGKTRPIADNKTDEGRLTNRRVEFHILEEGETAGSSSAPPAAPPASGNKAGVPNPTAPTAKPKNDVEL